MGDVGALGLGGGLGTVAVLLKQEVLLLFIGGVYVIEALSVILQVASFKLRGKRIFKMAPLHHHFEKLGWTESKIITRFWIVGLIHGAVRADDVETSMKLDGARVVVIGMATSGVAAVELLLEKGARVRAVDEKATERPVADRTHDDRSAEFGAALAGADLIVLSPGVPADLDIVNEARSRGVRVIGDLELASWYLQGGIIGITGSNGKTTTTALTGHILESSGIAAQVGGNIGRPPASMVEDIARRAMERAGAVELSTGNHRDVSRDILARRST